MREKRKPLRARLLGFFSLALISLALSSGFFTPVSAANECPDGSVPTSILGEDGCASDDGAGSGIMDLLTTTVNIMSVGAAILAAVGIAFSGIQYISAGGSEEQVRKSKRRIFEIVIGMIVYALAYGLLAWLLPGFGV